MLEFPLAADLHQHRRCGVLLLRGHILEVVLRVNKRLRVNRKVKVERLGLDVHARQLGSALVKGFIAPAGAAFYALVGKKRVFQLVVVPFDGVLGKRHFGKEALAVAVNKRDFAALLPLQKLRIRFRVGFCVNINNPLTAEHCGCFLRSGVLGVFVVLGILFVGILFLVILFGLFGFFFGQIGIRRGGGFFRNRFFQGFVHCRFGCFLVLFGQFDRFLAFGQHRIADIRNDRVNLRVIRFSGFKRLFGFLQFFFQFRRDRRGDVLFGQVDRVGRVCGDVLCFLESGVIRGFLHALFVGFADAVRVGSAVGSLFHPIRQLARHIVILGDYGRCFPAGCGNRFSVGSFGSFGGLRRSGMYFCPALCLCALFPEIRKADIVQNLVDCAVQFALLLCGVFFFFLFCVPINGFRKGFRFVFLRPHFGQVGVQRDNGWLFVFSLRPLCPHEVDQSDNEDCDCQNDCCHADWREPERRGVRRFASLRVCGDCKQDCRKGQEQD